MDMSQLRDANRLLERIGELDRLATDIKGRDIDFVDGERTRRLGRMQIDEDAYNELRDRWKQVTVEWLNDRNYALLKELKALGVDTGV